MARSVSDTSSFVRAIPSCAIWNTPPCDLVGCADCKHYNTCYVMKDLPCYFVCSNTWLPQCVPVDVNGQDNNAKLPEVLLLFRRKIVAKNLEKNIYEGNSNDKSIDLADRFMIMEIDSHNWNRWPSTKRFCGKPRVIMMPTLPSGGT